MKIRTGRAVAAGILIGLSLTATGAYAQLGDMLKQAGGSATQNSGGLGPAISVAWAGHSAAVVRR